MNLRDMEERVIARIRTLTYLRTVATYGGELEEAMASLQLLYPAVLVVYDGSNFAGEGYPAFFYAQEVRFSVILLDRNLRGEQERRHGMALAAPPGTYVMLSDVLRLLSGHNLGLPDAGPLEPVSVRSLLQGKQISAYEAIFRTNVDFQATA